jgi:ATP-dependent Clp protease protease subunit
MTKARQFAARVQSPVGAPFSAKKKGSVAELYLYDAIGRDPFSDTGIDPKDVVAAVAEAKGADELQVHVNSPGGYVFDGISIFNAIRAFDGKKTVFVDGVAASIASIIALAGDRVVTNEGAMWMIHNPMGGVFSFGTADEIEDDARKTVTALRKVRENLIDIYVSATGQAISDISKWMTTETWMTADEALGRGFTDEVFRPEPAPEEKPTPRKAAAMSPRVMADLARAQARVLHERFAGNGPGGHPSHTGSPKAGVAGRSSR